MNSPIRVLGADFPVCAHEGCRKHGEDGYCMASCCVDVGLAYCSEHSHRPTRVLEILGHSPSQQTFRRDELERIVKAMWVGAGMVFEAAGYFEMLNDLRDKRESESGSTEGLDGFGGK